MEMQAEISRIVNSPSNSSTSSSSSTNGSTSSSSSSSSNSWSALLGRGGKIDIEKVQSEAEETLVMLEGKLDSENGWFFGTE